MRYMTDVLVVVSNRDIKEHKAVFVQLIEKVVNEFGYEKVNEFSICKKKKILHFYTTFTKQYQNKKSIRAMKLFRFLAKFLYQL